jgi:hypothetical protein
MPTAQDVIDAFANLRNAVVDLNKRFAQPARPGANRGEELWRHARQFAFGSRGSALGQLFKGHKSLAIGRAGPGLRRIKIGGRRAARFAGRLAGPGRSMGARKSAMFSEPAASWGPDRAADFLTTAIRKQAAEGNHDGAGIRFERTAIALTASASDGGVEQYLGKKLYAYDSGDGKDVSASSLRKQLEEVVQQAMKDAAAGRQELIGSQPHEDRESTVLSKWITQAAEVADANRKRADDRIRAMREGGRCRGMKRNGE